MIRVSKPAAMSGPTGTPRSKATPATVPTSKPATTSGWFDISFTPRPPSHATKTPIAMASNDLTLKKGWNVVYDSYTGDSYSLTSQKPSGVNYTWNFYDDSSFRSASIATKSVENTKSAFSKLKESRKKRLEKLPTTRSLP